MKTKHERITVSGTVKFARLDKPDTKFNTLGVYSMKVQLEDGPAEKLEEKLKELAEAAFKQAVSSSKDPKFIKTSGQYQYENPVRPNEDKEGNTLDGKVINFKSNAAYVDKKTNETKQLSAPPVFDAKKNQMKNPKVGGGSVVKAVVELVPYVAPATKKYGMSLRLQGVQVLELVTYGEKSADSLGFSEEDGYEVDDSSGSSEMPEGSTAGASGDADF